MRSGVLIAVLFASTSAYAGGHKALCSGGTFRCFAHWQTDDDGNIRHDAVPFGFGPPDLISAYNIDTSVDPGVTIAIIDAYGYPSLESDLATYRSTFGLPECSTSNGCLKIINTSGQTSPLPGNAPSGDDWTGETALDMDMISAGCPKCKIVVVQANDDVSNGLLIGNTTAAQAGAQVVSNSWGQREPPAQNLPGEDANFTHAGVIYFASTGDTGFEGNGASYPASSSHVFAVGGTSLVQDVTSVRGWKETAWDGGSSGCSNSVKKPTYQKDTACPNRATADLSAVGDPATGVAVFNNGQWGEVGGTSASSPLMAAIFAVTGNKAATPDYPYTNAGNFVDVTGGNNGTCSNMLLCNAAVGWDGPTGNGTPNGAMLAGAKAPSLMVSPENKQAVPAGFTVDVTCTSNDSATIKQVEISIDGEHFGKLTTAPFTFNAPTTFANGKHTVGVECTTSSLANASVSFAVTQVAACTTASDCPTSTDLCFDGACIPGPNAAGGLGASCTMDKDCNSAECASAGSDMFCVIACDANMTCPDGFECDTGAMVCAPGGGGSGGGGGGCDSRGGSSGVPLVLGLGIAALAIARRRS